ncbi:S8 family serine peptidase [Gottfriedia acidiceleris]|uniref:S8 family serine peptidase n=1 Tax=Gottfriedia acidiceleris TaxID=371036 RepID=UPI00101DB6CD|nr:S8 family serine peptidase [Gottfriedia acidiceleris]
MKNSKVLPYKVLTTVGLAALLISSTAFAESPAGFSANDNSIDHSSIRERAEFFKSGFSNEENQNTDNDQNGLSNLYGENSNKMENQFKPNDKVRIIVEVDSSVDSSTSETAKENKFKENQDGVIDKIKKSKDLDLKVKHRFFKGLNGFSTETEYKNLKDIQSTKGVVHVHIAREFEPSMAASKELVQAQKVWESYGYQGEGLVVGVVDSGVDWLHKDMTITDKGKQQEKLTKNNIQGKLDGTDVNEIWYSDKVPTGYDWADNDTDVVPHGLYGSPHGTHVAGTVGANGDEATDGVKGIAPGVQLLAEKVFSDNGGGAYEDDIIAGIQHAVTMGADVINMSLGVDSGYVGEDYDPIQKAIREATEEGTLVVVAGGNSSYSTNNIKLSRSLKPYADNPDIGTVGAPGVSPFALSVASYENSKIHMNSLKSTTGDILPYKDQAGKKLSDVLTSGKNYDLVYVGAGRAADYANKNVEGKIVVMKPDSETGYSANVVFQNEAQKRKAVAILQVPGAKMPDYPAMDFSPYYLTAMTTSKAVGNDLIAKLTSGQNVSMQMSSIGTYVDNATKDNMSFFSSYGTPSTLEFKPEISAPGGSIYSTLPGNKYGVFSGTSMATPHVAGGSALVLQSLYQKGNAHSEDTALKTKLALMNTSKVIMDPSTDYTIPYSPRRQGSGLMQIENAIKTPAILRRTNVPLEEAGAVALKEIKNKNFVTFNLSLESLEANKTSNKNDLEYSVYVDLLTDGTENKSFDYNKDGVADESHDYLTLKSKRVEGAKIVVNNQTVTASNGAVVSVKPGQKREIEVQISLPSEMKDKQFLEGFVRLVPTGVNKDQAVPLTVPYMGFFGDWTEPNNLDPVAWSDKAFLGYTALWDDMSDYPMGYNQKTGKFNMNESTISPNTIAPGVFSSFTALRNLKETEMYVEDAEGNKVKWLGNWSEYTPDGTPYKFRKNMMFNGDFFYRFDEFDAPNYTWNERNEKGEIVPDGTYYYVIKTTMDYPTAKPQYVKLPVKVDSTLVKISNIQYKPTTNGKFEVTWDAVDSENGSGYNNAVVYVNGQYFEAKNGSKSIIVSNEPKSIVVQAYDKAGNISYSLWGDPSYIKESMMLITFSVSGTNVNETTPARIVSFANNRVNWKLIMKDANGNLIDTFDVENEHSLRVSFLPDSDIPDGTYYVSAEVTSLDGFKVTTKPKSFTVKH